MVNLSNARIDFDIDILKEHLVETIISKVEEYKQRVIREWAGEETAAAWAKYGQVMQKEFEKATEALADAAADALDDGRAEDACGEVVDLTAIPADGWALVLPHASEPTVTVWAEADSDEAVLYGPFEHSSAHPCHMKNSNLITPLLQGRLQVIHVTTDCASKRSHSDQLLCGGPPVAVGISRP